jgi:mono/diheme cytochrome c family protein
MSRATHALAAVLCLLAASGCRQEMANEPKYKPLQESDFFGDSRSARPLEPGTVPHDQTRGAAREFSETGAAPEPRWAAALFGLGNGNGFGTAAVLGAGYVSPVPVTYDLLKRGRERFDIYCAVCHDRVGTGNGKIVERGYLHPPSYHIDRLRNAPLMHYYDVVSNGFGAMPSYSDKLSPNDRWAVIAYIRALQLSQHASYADLTGEKRGNPPSNKERP